MQFTNREKSYKKLFKEEDNYCQFSNAIKKKRVAYLHRKRQFPTTWKIIYRNLKSLKMTFLIGPCNYNGAIDTHNNPRIKIQKSPTNKSLVFDITQSE